METNLSCENLNRKDYQEALNMNLIIYNQYSKMILHYTLERKQSFIFFNYTK